jgi:hypothetical protein
MNSDGTSNRRFSAVGWGMLCILWGVSILFEGVTLGVALIGTGLILLGANAARVRRGLPARGDNTILGVLALSWGVLEFARPVLEKLPQLTDPDWAILAILLIIIGAVLLARELLLNRNAIHQE